MPCRRCRRMPRRARAVPQPRAALRCAAKSHSRSRGPLWRHSRPRCRLYAHQRHVRRRQGLLWRHSRPRCRPAPSPIPASSHSAGGPRPPHSAIVTADSRPGRPNLELADGPRPGQECGAKPRRPASARAPSALPATHLHILPRQGMGGPSGPGPGWPASPRCSRTSYAANPMRAPFPPPFPPLPAIFQPAGRLRMPAVPVRLGRGTACPPCFETPGASSAAPHHRRACLLSAASAGTSSRAGAVPAPPPGPARTRHPPCAPQGRRIPSPLSRPGRPPTRQERGWAPQPPPARRGAAPLSHAMPACVRQHMTP